ncbi:transmembrane protein 272 [Nothobranchius furzeri]|nr:transmembrane protein 272-like [Nothobranchius furzeri]
MESRPQSAVVVATLVVVNIIWWMQMLAAIGLGATHLNRCPVQPYIPIYLIVLGANGIISLIFTYITKIKNDGAIHALSLACMTFLHIFSFAWLIAGSVWVYAVYPPNYSGTDRFCHKTTYLFAFVITTLLWAAVSFLFICGGCCMLLTCCTTLVARQRLIPSRYSFYGATGEPAAGEV